MGKYLRKWSACFLAAAILSGCGQSGGVSGPADSLSSLEASSETVQSGEEAPPSAGGPSGEEPYGEYEDLLKSAFISSVLLTDWKSPEEIPAHILTNFYSIDTLYPQYPDGWDQMEVPVEEVAGTLAKTFEGVTADMMRGKSHVDYNQETDSISFHYGIGCAVGMDITDVREENGLTVVEFDALGGDIPGNIIAHTVLTADFTATPRKYMSCAVTRFEPKDLYSDNI